MVVMVVSRAILYITIHQFFIEGYIPAHKGWSVWKKIVLTERIEEGESILTFIRITHHQRHDFRCQHLDCGVAITDRHGFHYLLDKEALMRQLLMVPERILA